jgi:hypothetical protein
LRGNPGGGTEISIYHDGLGFGLAQAIVAMALARP